MKKAFMFFVLFIVACMFLTSCDSGEIIKPVGSLLSPPLYYEEYEALVEEFNKKIQKNVSFCSPKRGNYRSAIIVEDVDSDGETEALIFYRDSLDSSVARMHYFNVVDGRWVSGGDFNGYGNEVERVILTDMDGDGNSELIIAWSVSGVSNSNITSVYRASYSIGEYKEISNESCALCEVLDVDGDNKKELFLISQNTVSGVSQRLAKVMRLSGDSVVLMGETKIDPNISSYVSLKTEKVSGDSPLRIYIDAFKGGSQMITELIYWDKEKSELCAPMLDAETMSNTATLRYEPIGCADINNDGIIDIPVQTQIFGSGDDILTKDTEDIYITKWVDFTYPELKVVENTLVNYSDGYMIFIEENEINTTGIRNYRSQNCWVVYRTDEKGESVGELYSVLKISAERWKSEDFDSYIPIVEKEEGTVCAYVTDSGKEMGVDENYIKTRITKIPQ